MTVNVLAFVIKNNLRCWSCFTKGPKPEAPLLEIRADGFHCPKCGVRPGSAARECRACGCTDETPCYDPAVGGPCAWVTPHTGLNLCSRCWRGSQFLVSHVKADAGASPGEVYVGRGRGSVFGNPFKVAALQPTLFHTPQTLATEMPSPQIAVIAFRSWLMTQPDLIAKLAGLRGLRLSCWCRSVRRPRPDVACHAEPLVYAANAAPWIVGDKAAAEFGLQPIGGES